MKLTSIRTALATIVGLGVVSLYLNSLACWGISSDNCITECDQTSDPCWFNGPADFTNQGSTAVASGFRTDAVTCGYFVGASAHADPVNVQCTCWYVYYDDNGREVAPPCNEGDYKE